MSKKVILVYIFGIIVIGIGAVVYIHAHFANQSMADNAFKSDESAAILDMGRTADLGFERSGKIILVAKKVGEHVAAGEILAKIDDADILIQYDQARAGVLVAQADLAALQDSFKKEKLKLKAEGLSANDKKIQKAQIALVGNNIVAQEARLSQARNNEKNANIQLDKNTLKSPFDGIITRMDIELGEIVNPNVSVITITENNIK